jgi:hypothetical protein
LDRPTFEAIHEALHKIKIQDDSGDRSSSFLGLFEQGEEDNAYIHSPPDAVQRGHSAEDYQNAEQAGDYQNP